MAIDPQRIVTDNHRRDDEHSATYQRAVVMPSVAAWGIAVTILIAAGSVVRGYGSLEASQKAQAESASEAKQATKDTLREIRDEVKEVKATVSKQAGDLAEIRARQTVTFLQQAAPQGQKGKP